MQLTFYCSHLHNFRDTAIKVRPYRHPLPTKPGRPCVDLFFAQRSGFCELFFVMGFAISDLVSIILRIARDLERIYGCKIKG